MFHVKCYHIKKNNRNCMSAVLAARRGGCPSKLAIVAFGRAATTMAMTGLEDESVEERMKKRA